MPTPIFERFLNALVSWAEPIKPYVPEDRPSTGTAKISQEARVSRLKARLEAINTDGALEDDDFELKEDVFLGPDERDQTGIEDQDDDDQLPETAQDQY